MQIFLLVITLVMLKLNIQSTNKFFIKIDIRKATETTVAFLILKILSRYYNSI